MILDGLVDAEAYKPLLGYLDGVVGPWVLEIGFGTGTVHNYLHTKPISRIWVIEINPEVIADYKTCDCITTIGDWRKVISGNWDDVVYDVEINPPPGDIKTLKTFLSPGGALYVHTTRYDELFEAV